METSRGKEMYKEPVDYLQNIWIMELLYVIRVISLF